MVICLTLITLIPITALHNNLGLQCIYLIKCGANVLVNMVCDISAILNESIKC